MVVRFFRQNRDGNKNLQSRHDLGSGVSIVDALIWAAETLKRSPETSDIIAEVDVIGDELAKK